MQQAPSKKLSLDDLLDEPTRKLSLDDLVDAPSAEQEGAPSLADEYWKARTTVQPREPDLIAGGAGEFAGMAVTATGQAVEAIGRFGSGIQRRLPSWAQGGQTRSFMNEPGPVEDVGKALQKTGEEIKPKERAALAEQYPRTSAGLGMAGGALPLGVGTLVAPEVTVPLIGGAMMSTQFRQHAVEHGATPEQADTAAEIGALAGAAGGHVLKAFGPLGRFLGRLSKPETEVLGAIAKEVAAGTGTGMSLAIAQNLTAQKWVGYEKDKDDLLEGLSVIGPASAGVSLVTSLLGLGFGPAPKRPGRPAVEPKAETPKATLETVEAVLEAPKVSEEAPAAPAVEAPPVATEQSPAQPAPTTTATEGTTSAEPHGAKGEQAAPISSGGKSSAEAELRPDAAISSADAPISSGAETVRKAPEKVPETESAKEGDLSKLTGIKNEAVDAEFAAMGVDPPTHGERITFEGEVAKARATLESDAKAGERLVAEIGEKPRTISSEEGAMLLVEMTRIKNERAAARKALDEARNAGEGVDEAQKRVAAASDAYLKAGEAATVAGTHQGQSLAFRRAMLKEDYSLAEMERAVRDAKGGEELTEAETAEVTKLHDEIAKLTESHAALTARNKELEASAAAKAILPAIKERAKRNMAARPSSEVRERLAKGAEEARAYFIALSKQANVGLPVDALPHLARIGADLIAKGADEFKAWSEAIIGEIGERARPHLEETFKAAKAILHEARTEHLVGRVGARLKAGKDIGNYAHQIALQFVREGVHEIEPLIDAVHGVLKRADPKITREQARDAMSGYGRYRKLSADEMKRQLADLKGQAQKLAQIEALEKKLAPLKTGFERVEPSAKTRELQKRVNDLRKSTGIKAQDPTSALKTALQSKETSLRNRIEDLQHEIDTGERIVKVETPSPTSPVTEALEAQLAKLRERHQSIFGKPGMSDEQRARAAIKATERDIADNLRRLEQMDLSRKVPRQGPGTEAVEKLRREHDALVARNRALKSELKALKLAAEGSASAKLEARLQKQIDEFDKAKVKQGPRQGPDTEAVAKLKAQLKALRDAPSRRDEMALRAKKTRDRNAIADILERIARDDFDKAPPKKPLALDQEAVALEAKKKLAQVEFKKLKARHEYANRTRRQKILDAAQEVLNLPRAIWSAYDVSAVFRQGGFLTLGSSPVKTARQIAGMFRAAASAETAQRIDTEIRARPGYEFGRASKLELTSLHSELGPQEEAIRSRLSDRIPGVKASNRAFITFLNEQRAEAFDSMVRALPGNPTPEQGRAIAHFVNVATGRGEAKMLAPAMQPLGRILWSPRLLLSRLQLVAGDPLVRGSAETRKVIAKQYAKTLLGLSAVYGLAMLAGADLEGDARSSDFGKIKVGPTRIDPLAGIGQITVLLTRVATGQKKSVSGKITSIRGDDVPYGGDTVADILWRFGRSKLTPILGSALNVAAGEDVVGNKATLKTEAQKAAFPLSLKDIYEAMKADGVAEGAALGIVGFFGMGLQTIQTDSNLRAVLDLTERVNALDKAGKHGEATALREANSLEWRMRFWAKQTDKRVKELRKQLKDAPDGPKRDALEAQIEAQLAAYTDKLNERAKTETH